MKFGNKLSNIIEWIIIVLGFATAIFIGMTVFGNVFDAATSYNVKTNMVFHILAGLGFFAVGIFVDLCSKKLSEKIKMWLCVVIQCVSVGMIMIVGITFVSQTKIAPPSDSHACYLLANSFMNGDYSAVVPKDSYLTLWPYQTGLIFILEKTMKLLNTTDYVVFMRINVIFVALIVVSGYQIIRRYTKSVGACLGYSALMCTYFPLIFYTYWIYGNIPATALMVFSTWMFLMLTKSNEKWQTIVGGIGFFISTILACVYKSTCKIYLIALMIVLIIYVIKEKKLGIFAVVSLTLILAFFSTNFTQKYYEKKADNICGPGIPAVSFFAMGLQYQGEERIPGGWNGYHSNLYIELDYDRDKAIDISKESIKESVEEFKNDPEFARNFFYTKLMKQWANQTHGVFWNTSNMGDTDAQNGFWRRYIEYKSYNKWLPFMDYHESILYSLILLGFAGVVFRKIKNKNDDKETQILDILPVIVFIGGFLFSIIWEAQTQAVMYYPVILLPYMVGMAYSSFTK